MPINISQPEISEQEINAVLDVLKSGMLVQGKIVDKFEHEISKLTGSKYVVAVNSGTAALHCALNAMGVTKNDEVITTPFTFGSTANSILMQGAKVVFSDISIKDYNLDPELIPNKITNLTKAILPVDLYGQIFDVESFLKLSKKYSIPLIEDACQAINSTYKGKQAGRFGTAGVFSFYATKNIMCGEGGAIVTDSKDIYEHCLEFRNHGQKYDQKYQYFTLGYNYRLTDVFAAIGIEQLKKINTFTNRRVENASLYSDKLKNINGIKLPTIKKHYTHVFNQYTIRVTGDYSLSRDKISEKLKEAKINVGLYYPIPLHLTYLYKKFGYKEGDFPVAEQVAKQVLSLPVHPQVTEANINKIVNIITQYA